MVDALWLFGNEDHADARVVIVEEGAGGEADTVSSSARMRTRKRGRRTEGSGEGPPALPIHTAIVASASEFFKARLGAWQGTNNSNNGEGPCRVVLHVPPGQLELGRRLLRAMYEAKPSFDDLSIEQRLQLLGLADRYGAPEVLAAAAAAVGDPAVVSNEGLAWAAVRMAYSSPAAAGSQAAALQEYAAAALQLLFGDLEAVWAAGGDEGDEKQSNLLALPHAALKALLADERTRTASENTVMHSIVSWVDQHQLAPTSEQVKELLALVRVARLTPHYARSVFCESKLAKAHLSAHELALAATAPLVVGDEPYGLDDWQPSWRLPARPRSALADALVLEWSPRLAEVEACAAALPAEGEDCKCIDGPKGVVWQGWPLHFKLECKRSASGVVMLGVRLAALPPGRVAVALIRFSLEAVAAGGGNGTRFGSAAYLYTAAEEGWGDYDFFELDGEGADNAAAPKDWAGVEAALRAKRLVHGGRGSAAHLNLRCMVTRLE
jgi:hypothetical protein